MTIERSPNLLSDGEFAFFEALERAVGNYYRIMVKVRLGDLVSVRGSDSQSVTMRNKTWQKHVDFVLCSFDRVRPVLAIELDDVSHDSPDRVARDNFVDDCLRQVGFPILHWRCQRAYDVSKLAAGIRDRIE